MVSWSLEWGLLRWERPGGTPEQLLPGKIVRHLRRDRRNKSPSKDLKVRAWHLPAPSVPPAPERKGRGSWTGWRL